MKRLYQTDLIQEYIEKYGISQAFSCEGLEFYVARYSAGEVIASPDEEKRDLQIFLSEDISLYRLQDNGGIYGIDIAAMEQEIVVLGDVEFVHPGMPHFFAEAKRDTASLCLPISPNREKLLNNKDFLLYLLDSLAYKISFASCDQRISLEKRLLIHMRYMGPEHAIYSIEETAAVLGCSSRQLMRVLKKLAEENKIVKVKRGCYRLIEDEL
ncbi:MAG: hypothetical protein Q4F41_18935 [Eubacteriales bacterium]|nr:hypothetical protein [Eubacteriales bacterium]